MDELYPAGPADVPADLTAPTRAYKLHAWLSVSGLLAFVVVYLGLTGWFGWVAYRSFADALDPDAGSTFLGILGSVPPAFICLFLFKGLFAVKHHTPRGYLEVTAEEEPVLHAFIARIADEAGAPRPHRVFLAPNVNAAVFYDLSILNLFLPTKKNLVIGLGLVNCLTLGEIKAVVAHEFGHFAQNTMAIGRWVYVAEQIARHVIAERDHFDRILQAISHFDIRVAWIGWIMRVFVWALRALLDTLFRFVIMARSALSREMELQADLVSVSLAGSDLLVHALRKLQAADDAYDRALSLASDDFYDGHLTADLYAVQSAVLGAVGRITGDPLHGKVAPPPSHAPESHRVFPEHFAQAPRMWATHPPSREREDNAKRRYIPSTLDDREAWALFRDPDATRTRMTHHQLRLIACREMPEEAEPIDETLARVAGRYARASLDRRYRGAYLGRPITRAARSASELYERPDDPGACQCALDALYPESLASELVRWRELEEEHALLEALRDGVLAAPGGVIRHRGQEIRRRDLKTVVERVDAERRAARMRIDEHDRACRSAHMAAARKLGGGWDAYLLGLAQLLHYAEHSAANIDDAGDHLGHVFAIVTVDGHISSRELTRLHEAAVDVHAALAEVMTHVDQLSLPAAVGERLGVTKTSELFPLQGLRSTPTKENLGDWLRVVNTWVTATRNGLAAVARATLEHLLETEAAIADAVTTGVDPGPAPEPALAPRQYTTLPVGGERPRQKRLGLWDRFQIAEGIVPSLARFAVATGILALGFGYGGGLQRTDMHLYNGLGIPVVTHIAGESYRLAPGQHQEISLTADRHLSIDTRTQAGAPIERFEADAHSPMSEYVYNVASAAPMVEWTAVYGNAEERPPRHRGAERFFSTRATAFFGPPPKQVKTSGGGATRLVLAALTDEPPTVQLKYADGGALAVVRAHIRYDNPDDATFDLWLEAATSLNDLPDLLHAREPELGQDAVHRLLVKVGGQ